MASPVKILETSRKLLTNLDSLIPNLREAKSTHELRVRIEMNAIKRNGDLLNACWLAAKQKSDSVAIVEGNRIESIEFTKDISDRLTRLKEAFEKMDSGTKRFSPNEAFIELQVEGSKYLKELESGDFP